MTPASTPPSEQHDASQYPETRAAQHAAVAEVIQLVRDRTGYDFSEYQPPFLLRRLRLVANRHGAGGDLVKLAEMARADASLPAEVAETLSLAVTEMFRDPSFFRTFRRLVMPQLRTYPLVRIWIAGCATGEEAYSFAIMFDEEGFGDHYQIYATDINRHSLQRAQSGFVDVSQMQLNSRNYLEAGGTRSLSHYYTAHHGSALIHSQARRRIVVAHHNLTTDGRFNSFNVVVCRNVLIYFDSKLHARVHKLLYESLTPLGTLALGARESLRLSGQADRFRCLDQATRIYQKVE